MGVTYEHMTAQELRQSKFPKDRIAFRSNATAASRDTAAMERWQESKHTIWDMEKLCKDIAYNNGLKNYWRDGMIPIDMMQNELRLLGYTSEIVDA